MIDITELETRLNKAKIRRDKAKVAYESATTEVGRLETTLSVVSEMAGTSKQPATTVGGLTLKQRVVVDSLNFGQNSALSPVDVYQLAASNEAFDGDVNYVRTTLWRMADKGAIGSANGTYWKYPELIANDERESFSHFGSDSDESEDSTSFQPWDDDSEAPF